jgi:hypothetical protein
MSTLKYLTPITKKLRFLPYALVGIGVFSFNANPDINPYLQVYVTILEAQAGIALVYLLSQKMRKLSKGKQSM